MYSLDINFLRDRAPTSPTPGGGGPKVKKPVSMAAMIPLFAGIGAGVAAILAVVGFWGWVNWEKGRTEEQLAELQTELIAIEAKNQEVKELETKIQIAQAQADSLAGVFSQIKSWSAVLQDIRDRIPKGITLGEVKQTQAPPATEGETAAKPPVIFGLSGFADSYTTLNDFVLSLKESELLNGEETRLRRAELADYPIDNKPEGLEMPKVVNYEIVTQLSELPDEELLRELERKGALGLATRLRTVEEFEQAGEAVEQTGETVEETGGTVQ